MASRRPRAIGLVSVPIDSTRSTRTRHRVRVALYAAEAGFALVETFDIDGRPVRDDVAFRDALRVANDVGAKALVVAGNLDPERIGEVARAAGLFVRQVPNVVDPVLQ